MLRCIGKECSLYPSEKHFKDGGSMCSGCEHYPGYGCCYNEQYGIRNEIYKAIEYILAKGW